MESAHSFSKVNKCPTVLTLPSCARAIDVFRGTGDVWRTKYVENTPRVVAFFPGYHMCRRGFVTIAIRVHSFVRACSAKNKKRQTCCVFWLSCFVKLREFVGCEIFILCNDPTPGASISVVSAGDCGANGPSEFFTNSAITQLRALGSLERDANDRNLCVRCGRQNYGERRKFAAELLTQWSRADKRRVYWKNNEGNMFILLRTRKAIRCSSGIGHVLRVVFRALNGWLWLVRHDIPYLHNYNAHF